MQAQHALQCSGQRPCRLYVVDPNSTFNVDDFYDVGDSCLNDLLKLAKVCGCGGVSASGFGLDEYSPAGSEILK